MVCGQSYVNMSNQKGHDMKKAVLLCGLLLAGAASAPIIVDYDSETIAVNGTEYDFQEASGVLAGDEKTEFKSILQDKIIQLDQQAETALENDNKVQFAAFTQKIGRLQTVVDMLSE